MNLSRPLYKCSPKITANLSLEWETMEMKMPEKGSKNLDPKSNKLVVDKNSKALGAQPKKSPVISTKAKHLVQAKLDFMKKGPRIQTQI